MPWFHGVIALRVGFVLSFSFWREGQYVQDVSVHGLLKRGTPRPFTPEFLFDRSTRRGRRRIENLLLSTTALIKSPMAAIRGRLSVIVYGQPVVLACKQIEPGYALAAEKVSVHTFSLPASSLCGVCFSFSVAVSSWLYLITKTHVTSLHINAAFCRLIRLGR